MSRLPAGREGSSAAVAQARTAEGGVQLGGGVAKQRCCRGVGGTHREAVDRAVAGQCAPWLTRHLSMVARMLHFTPALHPPSACPALRVPRQSPKSIRARSLIAPFPMFLSPLLPLVLPPPRPSLLPPPSGHPSGERGGSVPQRGRAGGRASVWGGSDGGGGPAAPAGGMLTWHLIYACWPSARYPSACGDGSR